MTDMVAALKEPQGFTRRSDRDRAEAMAQFCSAIGISTDLFARMLEVTSGYDELEARCHRLEALLKDSKQDCQCHTIKSDLEERCDNIWAAARRACCPGNILFSQITLDEFSGARHTILSKVVQNFGAGYVNNFPVPVGSAIRLEQPPRPGYQPDEIRIDFALANSGNNYLDLEVTFYLGPGGTTRGKQIGPIWSGNEFLNKDGSQIHVEMPAYRGKVVEVGSVERMAVEIRNTGGGNNLTSAKVRLPYDEAKWYANCAAPGDC